jgi:hypothetical protein
LALLFWWLENIFEIDHQFKCEGRAPTFWKSGFAAGCVQKGMFSSYANTDGYIR